MGASSTRLARALLVVVACATIVGSAPSASAAGARVVLAPTTVKNGTVTFALRGIRPRQIAGGRAVCPSRRTTRLERRRLKRAARSGRLHIRPRLCRGKRAPRGGWRIVLRRATHSASHSQRPSQIVFRDGFDGRDALITNHYARWTRDPLAARSRRWALDSGSMLRRDGAAWTGPPTCNIPNRESSNGSGSAIFRAHLVKSDLPRDYRIAFDLRNNGFTQGCPGRPAAGWNGVKIYLRRLGPETFYTAEVSLRDGKAYIQKKIGDEYHILAQDRGHPARIGTWEAVGGSVQTNADGSVTVQVVRGGKAVLAATDRGVGGDPIRAGGQTGFRGDNTDFAVDDFTISAL